MNEDKPYINDDKPYMNDGKPLVNNENRIRTMIYQICMHVTPYINDDIPDMYAYHKYVWYHIPWGDAISSYGGQDVWDFSSIEFLILYSHFKAKIWAQGLELARICPKNDGEIPKT